MRKCTNKFDWNNRLSSNTVTDIRSAKYEIINQR